MNKLRQKIIIGAIAFVALSGITINQQNTLRPSHDVQTPDVNLQNYQSEPGSSSEPATTRQPVVETKTETKTRELPFETEYIDDRSLAKGTTKTTQNGANGIETTTYSVTYTDGKETAREITKVEVTKKPINQVIARGTYVAPKPAATTQNCPNGTYKNSAGNTVCRPAQSSTRPSGATARCRDGSYSYSQSRRGTCSHHGGVAQWY